MKQAVRQRQRILQLIVLVRGQKVILDSDIAKLYAVPTKVLIQAVKRNRSRFPADFMLRLNKTEVANLRSQIVTSSSWGGRRSAPHVFTELGVAMLSSVLGSPRAIRVNIQIMRAFVELRRMMDQHTELARRIDDLQRRYDANFEAVFDAIRQLITPRPEPRKRIGYLSARES